MKKKKELKDGYAYKFAGSDDIVTKLNEFIKTEKKCCDFFAFSLRVSSDKSTAWLEIADEKGVKDSIKTEIQM